MFRVFAAAVSPCPLSAAVADVLTVLYWTDVLHRGPPGAVPLLAGGNRSRTLLGLRPRYRAGFLDQFLARSHFERFLTPPSAGLGRFLLRTCLSAVRRGWCSLPFYIFASRRSAVDAIQVAPARFSVRFPTCSP